jgi:hypothetical protein
MAVLVEATSVIIRVQVRYRGEFLGNVKANSREAAESKAARLFSLSELHRRRLLLEERL